MDPKRNNTPKIFIILHLVEYLQEGGIERLLEQLARHTLKDKLRLSFFTYETPELTGIGKTIRDLGVPVFKYKKKNGTDLALIHTLFRTVKENQIDIIHTHDFGPTLYAILLKLRFPGLKLVHTQHTLHHFLPQRKYTIFFQLASWFYQEIICVSTYVKKEIKAHCPYINKKSLVVIHNGVDTEKFSFVEPRPERPGCLKMVSISRISPEKNLDLILTACQGLACQGVNFEFHHAGSGSAEEEARIQKLASLLKIERFLTFHGFRDDIRPILDLADVFISASRTEGHPVSVLEAMSRGKICVLSEIEGHSFVPKETALFFEANKTSLMEKLLYLQNNWFLSLKMARRAREFTEANFSIKKMINGYGAIYSHE